MSTRLRSLLLACALPAITFAWAPAPRSLPSRILNVLPGAVEDAAAADDKKRPDRRPSSRTLPKLSLGERAAAIALKAVGVPYRFGGMSPASGFDCSGLVSWAYGRLGVELPHSSYDLFRTGRAVARSRIEVGDVLVFSGLGHVGLYIGRGRMVHAPHSGRRVEIVRLGRTGYGGRIVGARRFAPA